MIDHKNISSEEIKAYSAEKHGDRYFSFIEEMNSESFCAGTPMYQAPEQTMRQI